MNRGPIPAVTPDRFDFRFCGQLQVIKRFRYLHERFAQREFELCSNDVRPQLDEAIVDRN